MTFKEMILNKVTALIVAGAFSFGGTAYAGYQRIMTQLEINTQSIGLLTDQNRMTNEILDKMRYETEFKELKVTLDGMVGHDEILGEVDYWIEKNKGSKLASLSTLCDQSSHNYLVKIMLTDLTANAACRKIGAI